MPLLASKLSPPRVPRWLVARTRLFGLLDAGVQGPVTLLVGPAGSGKTVLLASWTASAALPGPVAWVSLDGADNDPARFWAYLLAALRQSAVAPAKGPVGGLDLPVGGPDRGFVLGLAAALAKLEEPVVVILDDLHEIANPVVFAGLGAVLRHRPAALRLVMATRAEPSLPLALLRVAGQLTEVNADELAFTAGEAAALLADHGLVLADADLAVLQAQTQGWAAGLRLAALSLQDHPDPHEFIAQFSGGSRAVADYLFEEVLGRLPEDVRGFLLHTSVVERLSGDLADALTGRADGAQILARLEQANAFVVALGHDQDHHDRIWYRYHPLLADVLRAQLHASAARLVPRLHRRAATWYQGHGLPVEATQHALAGGQWPQAAELLAKVWRRFVLDGELTLLGELIDQFPARVIMADAELLAVRAAQRLGIGDWDGADVDLRRAKQVAAGLPQQRTARFGVTLATVSLYWARLRGDLDAAMAAAQYMLAPRAGGSEDLADDDLRGLTLLNLGIAEFWTGAVAAANNHLTEGLAAARRAHRDSLVVGFLGHLAAVVGGPRPREGVRLAHEALALAKRRGWSRHPTVACAYLLLGGAHFDWGDLDAADRYLDLAAACHPEPAISVTIAFTQAVVAHARGDAATGLELLRAAQQELQRFRGPYVLAVSLREWEARLLTATGRTAQAHALLDAAEAEVGASVATRAAQAELQLAHGDAAGALATLAPCLDGSVSPLVTYQRLETLLLDAVARQRLGDLDGAAASVERALQVAAPEGYRQVFWNLGGEVRALLLQQRDRGGAQPQLLTELLDRPVNAPATSPPPIGSPIALVEPLTNREQTVLGYLSSMLSTKEIADDLFISVPTVKSHLRGIYRKLAVNRRRDAVRRARQLKLL